MAVVAPLMIAVLVACGSATLEARAGLPKKPSCSDVSAALLKATFRYSFSHHWTSDKYSTDTLRHLSCVYSGDEGDVSIEYDRYSTAPPARAKFATVRKWLTRIGKRQPIDTLSQTLPLIKLGGIGDAALRTDDGTFIEFVDGVDLVRITTGYSFTSLSDPTPAIQRMVSLARHIDGTG